MRTNESTVVLGHNVILIPYRREHVPTYHEWMKSEELQQLTASEPLTLEQEYEMQQSWLQDNDKLTFIILANSVSDNDVVSNPKLLAWPLGAPALPEFSERPMIGDVNLFLKGEPPHLRSGALSGEEDDEFEAEAEIMIAESAYRRKGCAIEALRLILEYATRSGNFCRDLTLPSFNKTDPLPVPPTSLVIRISNSNEPSIKLFERLGFHITKSVEVFQEVEMRWRKS